MIGCMRCSSCCAHLCVCMRERARVSECVHACVRACVMEKMIESGKERAGERVRGSERERGGGGRREREVPMCERVPCVVMRERARAGAGNYVSPPQVPLMLVGEQSPRTVTEHGVWCGCRRAQVFRPTFRREERHGLEQGSAAGALLTVCWENGRIANYPLYFPSLEGEHNKAPFMNR